MSMTSAFGVLLAAWVCSAQNSSSIDGYRDFKLDFAGGITVGIVIAVVCLIWGLFYLFVGARYPKASVASNTFLFVTGGLYFLLNFFDIEPYICLIVGAVVGIVCIAITLKLWRVGLFVLGGAAGFVIWLVVKALAASSFTDVATVYASLAGVVIVAALLSIKFEKQIFIAGTSLIGSFFLVQGIDALIPGHASVFSLINDTTGLVCAYDYEWCTGIYIAIFVIAFLGMVVQFKITAKFYKRRRGVKNKSDYRRKRRGKRAYAKEDDEAPRERRRYRNQDEDGDRRREDRREERHERKHSDDAVAPSGGKGRLQEENAELRVRIGDLERKLANTQDKLDGAWDLTQEEKDLVTRFRVDKRENARIAKEAAAREKARQKDEQEARDAEERDRRRQEEEDERSAKKSRKSDKKERERREREREREEREREEERLRQEEEDAYAVKKSRKKTKDDPPPYKPEPEKKSKKKKSSEKKRRDSNSEDSAEG